MNREELLCRLARDYAENEGARLHEELNAIKAPPPSPGLDKRVRRGVFRLKYKVHMRVAGTLAACLALALVLPLMLQQQAMPGALAPQPQMAAPAAAPPPAAEELPEEAVVAFDGDFAAARIESEFYAETVPDAEPPMAGGGMEEFGDRYQLSGGAPLPPEGWADSPALPEMDANMLIPLGFALPDGFYQESSTARGGRSSHFLRSPNNDTIVLVIQDTYTPYEFIGYTPMQFGDYTIYYRSDAYQNVVAFQVGSTVYNLSGAGPMADFILLSEAIIAG